VAWSSDGKRLATGGYDATVQVYTMDIHDLMNLARQRITAHPSEEACQKLSRRKMPTLPRTSLMVGCQRRLRRRFPGVTFTATCPSLPQTMCGIKLILWKDGVKVIAFN
jgi:hypothetical protein